MSYEEKPLSCCLFENILEIIIFSYFPVLIHFQCFGDFVINIDIKEQILGSMIYTSKDVDEDFQGNLSRRL
jgi:hypothetical protein